MRLSPSAEREIRDKSLETDRSGSHKVMTLGSIGRAGLRYLVPVVVVAAAGMAGFVLIRTPPQTRRAGRSSPIPVVGVLEVEASGVPISVEAFGNVVPAREVRIQPEVSGRIVGLHPQLVEGGLIREGERLFTIDPSDYEIAVSQAEAETEVAGLEVERLQAAITGLNKDAEQVEAELTYVRWNTERLRGLSAEGTAGEGETREAQSRLASQEAALGSLRAKVIQQEKAVSSAQADVKASESKLASARLALTRTEVATPFDVIVLSESVEEGQLVSPQSTVARLVATGEFWVEAAVPVGRLADIRFARNDGGKNGSQPEANVRVTLSEGSSSGSGVVREGYALRALGELEEQGRMARVLIAVRDPLDLEEAGGPGRERLLLGSYVRLDIDAGVLRDVYVIPRRAVRENDRVWVRDGEGQLRIREVRIVHRRTDDVLVGEGLATGDEVVTTLLTSPVPGMALDVRTEHPPPDEGAGATGSRPAGAP